MDKNSTVVLVFGEFLKGDGYVLPLSLAPEVTSYDDGTLAIKFPGKKLSPIEVTNVIRNLLGMYRVKPGRVTYARYGSIWAVVRGSCYLSVNKLMDWLKGAPDLQCLFEEYGGRPADAKALPFHDKRDFVVWVTSSALKQVQEIETLWEPVRIYMGGNTKAYNLSLTTFSCCEEIQSRIDWSVHPDIVVTKLSDERYVIHLESEQITSVVAILPGCRQKFDGKILSQYNLCSRKASNVEVRFGEVGSVSPSIKLTADIPADAGNLPPIAKPAYEQRLEQAYKIVEDKDEFIQVLQKRLERSNNSILELSTRINVLELENRNSKTQREQARKAIKDLAERLARMSDNNRDFHSKVIELETANESLKVQLKLARSVSTAIDKQKDLPKNAFEPKYLVVKGVKYRV